MRKGLRGGSLGRWFEQLCRIEYNSLDEIACAGGSRLKPEILPKMGGVYAFWWTGNHSKLHERNKVLEISGPAKKCIRLEIDDEWLGIDTGLPVPLYVGKTASGIQKRIGLHLMLGKIKLGTDGFSRFRPTTSCQLRSGIDHLFPHVSDTRELMLRNVGLSFVRLDGDHEAANRFYLEDMAIGLMRPPFNVDVER